MTGSDADEAAIRALFGQVVRGWNEENGDMIATAFVPHSILIGYDGSETFGASSIATSMNDIFEGHQTGRWVGISKTVIFHGADAAVVHAVSGWLQPGGPYPQGVQLLTVLRTDAGWRIATLQTTPAQYHGHPEWVAHLDRELREAAGM